MTRLGRTAINQLHRWVETHPNRGLHPGLLLAHGMESWPVKGDSQIKAKLVERITNLTPVDLYEPALARWRRATSDKERFASFEAKLGGRLYIGVTRDHPLESGVTTSHSYGVPVIPGSAVKGLTRSAACELQDQNLLKPDAIVWMFGEGGDDGEAGGLVFHDAWWVGKDNPFVAEVVTPHHTDYYSSHGKSPATDMDSPIPAPQIAVRGSFYFVVEGDPAWSRAAAHILRSALDLRGIGAKRNSGYGFFNPSEKDTR
ncbi:MAG: type III-B CRISPR module RAMP protein Cmr6 [bacterium]|nr:type III-B CRISPR module RAMP protein Cmr6 [bacterium]